MFVLILFYNWTFTVAIKQHPFVTTNSEFCCILLLSPLICLCACSLFLEWFGSSLLWEAVTVAQECLELLSANSSPLSLLTGSIRLISDLFNKRNSLGFHCNMIFLWQLGRFFGGILLPLISSRWLMGNFRLSSEVGKHLYIVTTLIHLNMREGRLFLSQLRIYYSIVAFFNVQRSWRRVMLQPLVCKTCEPTKARHDNVNVMFSLLQWYCL